MSARVARRARKLSDEAWWAANTGEIQTRTLGSLIAKAARTRFGRAHGFAKLSRLSGDDLWNAYRQAVPVRDWYGFADDITLMREGTQPDVLWPGLVRDFAQTSGTTAGDKFIPLSREMMRSNYRAGLDIFAYAKGFGISLPRLFGGGALFLGGSSAVSEGPGGVRTGDLSGLATRLIRWPLTQVYLPGKRIALMDDWPAKIDAMAELCAQRDVRMVSGMPSWALVLCEKVLEITGETCIERVWPNFELLVHGGVRFEPFEPRFRRLWSGQAEGVVGGKGGGRDVPNRFELYPASEGFLAMQDAPNDPNAECFVQPSMRLNTDIGIVHEFVPIDEIDDANPRAHAAHEVERGVRYVVVLTTCAGLWRYILGDVVEFESVLREGHPARVRIVGRHRHFINAFGENIIVEHIEQAVAAAARATNAEVGEFTACPAYPEKGQPGRLELVIEFRREPSARTEFCEAFDGAIKAVNVDYTTKRTAGRGMALPRVTPVVPGSFHRWMASKGKLGGQHKCPRCANHREYVEGVMAAASGLSSSS